MQRQRRRPRLTRFDIQSSFVKPTPAINDHGLVDSNRDSNVAGLLALFFAPLRHTSSAVLCDRICRRHWLGLVRTAAPPDRTGHQSGRASTSTLLTTS